MCFYRDKRLTMVKMHCIYHFYYNYSVIKGNELTPSAIYSLFLPQRQDYQYCQCCDWDLNHHPKIPHPAE